MENLDRIIGDDPGYWKFAIRNDLDLAKIHASSEMQLWEDLEYVLNGGDLKVLSDRLHNNEVEKL